MTTSPMTTSPMTVAEMWRYPVKTLAGERLDTAELTADGVFGDRLVHVRGPEGVRTSRRHHRLLGLHATLGDDHSPLVDGLLWTSSEVLARVRACRRGPEAQTRCDGDAMSEHVQQPLKRCTAGTAAPVAAGCGGFSR